MRAHIIAHTHEDAGWRLSRQQYYDEFVSKSYDTLIQALIYNEQRTFVVSDILFFEMWFKS